VSWPAVPRSRPLLGRPVFARSRGPSHHQRRNLSRQRTVAQYCHRAPGGPRSPMRNRRGCHGNVRWQPGTPMDRAREFSPAISGRPKAGLSAKSTAATTCHCGSFGGASQRAAAPSAPATPPVDGECVFLLHNNGPADERRTSNAERNQIRITKIEDTHPAATAGPCVRTFLADLRAWAGSLATSRCR